MKIADFLFFLLIVIDLILPEIGCWRPLKRQTGQVNRSVGKQVENSHQTCYSIELPCKHYALKHKTHHKLSSLGHRLKHDCTPQKLSSPVPGPRCTALPPTDSQSLMWWQLGLTANLWGKNKSLFETGSKAALVWWVKTSSLTEEVIQSKSVEDTGRSDHSAHRSWQRGAVYADGDKRRPDVYFLEESIILNQ